MRMSNPVFCLFSFLLLGLLLSTIPTSLVALGDKTLTPDVLEALNRMGDGSLSEADRALLFANNDAINAARLNNEISDSIYQAAQSDFADLNRSFAADAAQHAGADFTVQQRTSARFSPGTDSDYITVVSDKSQVATMQSDYNRRVNDYLQQNGAIDGSSSNWHQKLDTDFMADPRYVSEADFREVAKMNNDAYTRRHAAEFEKISRQSGVGKIGPQHVTAYTEEMSDFVRKKKGKISDMFKNPSLFNDPANRAKVIQMMAQEQKYINRMESLDDYLRAQEGLPPRNRSSSIAAKGAARSPHNIKAIKDGHAVAEASRARAIEDLAETMGEVAKKNPHFAPTAADDIARIIGQAPPAHRAKAIAALRRSNPDLARTILARNPGLTSPDDIIRAGDKIGDLAKTGDKVGDIAKAGDQVSDLSKVAKMRKNLSAAADAMEKLGKVAAAADVAIAASQMKNYIDTINRALDPALTDEQAAQLFEDAARMGEELAKSSVLIAIMERHPVVAVIYGTWTVGCIAGEWVASDSESGLSVSRSSNDTCLDRQIDAWDNLTGRYGTEEEKAAQVKALCDKLKAAVVEGRTRIKWPYSVQDACNAIKRGEPIADLVEDPEGPAESSKQLCTNLNSQLETIKKAIDTDELDKAAGLLSRLQAKLQEYGPQVCPGLEDISAEQKSRISTKTTVMVGRIEEALDKCQVAEAWSIIQALPRNDQYRQLLDKYNRFMEGRTKINELISEVVRLEQQGELAAALKKLIQGNKMESCPEDRTRIGEAIARITQQVAGMAAAALDKCKFNESKKLINSLPKGDQRSELEKRWVDTYEKERQAKDLVKQAKVFIDQQENGKAIGKLHQANDLTRCDGTSSLIDKAIAELDRPPDPDSACQKYGPGYHLGLKQVDGNYYCVPDQATADQKCNEMNPGNGWVAREIRADGSFDCDRTQESADAVCNQANNGTGYIAHNFRDDGSFDCTVSQQTANERCNEINPGFGWVARNITDLGAFECERTQQSANAVCDQINNGTGYIANNFREDGSFDCTVSQQTANNWCNTNQPGEGWVAVNITSDGRYECVRTQESVNAVCDRINNGQGYTAGNFRPDGSFDCFRPQETVAQCPEGYWLGENGECVDMSGFINSIQSISDTTKEINRTPDRSKMSGLCPPGQTPVPGGCQ
ncbi:MAG: hypothetical protein D6B25_17525 [Desulfobulbaceae bacterium]|nr:MAG: hypothetical protein D6B25_17525 [Desulfobulbaceae bacterium]